MKKEPVNFEKRDLVLGDEYKRVEAKLPKRQIKALNNAKIEGKCKSVTHGIQLAVADWIKK